MAQLTKKKHSYAGLWIVLVAAAALEAITCIQYFTSRAAIRVESERRARTELQRAEMEIEKHTIEMETAARALAMLAGKYVNTPDSVYSATRAIVGAIRNTSSLAVAYVPDYFPEQGKYFEVCSSRISEDSIYTRQIGSAVHDYTQMEWFRNGFTHDSCWWCEPYLDDSGSQTWVVSCSCPVRDGQGNVVAVVCVDLSLDYLQDLSEYLQIYQDSYYSIYSHDNQQIVSCADTVPGRRYQVYDEEIDATGWKITIIIPEDVIFADLNRIGRYVGALMILGLLILILIVLYTGRNVKWLIESTARNQSMENELQIASAIQMAMLPTRFPPFPDYPGLNAYGSVLPAKEVGGDLFDFYIRDSRLFFCIGDVSGKGVPAALVMAVTRSLFRSFTSYIESPAQIMTQINDSLGGENNDQNMFVTLFVGVLDLTSGHLQYCNAGHDAPVHISNSESRILPCDANLPVGVLSSFAFTEQTAQLEIGDTLFLYTDGLNEAENGAHEQFGMERVRQTVGQWNAGMTASEQITAMQKAVAAFVGEAEQSDDLTMFAIRFMDKSQARNLHSEAGNHYSLVMRNDIQQIPTLAEWIDSIGLPQELNMPVNLALEEAVTNVMLYAYPDASGQVLVEAETSPGRVVFTISDSGVAFDPTQQKEPDLTQGVEERPIGGLGIFLVRQIMDDVAYARKDDRNILTLVKHFNS